MQCASQIPHAFKTHIPQDTDFCNRARSFQTSENPKGICKQSLWPCNLASDSGNCDWPLFFYTKNLVPVALAVFIQCYSFLQTG